MFYTHHDNDRAERTASMVRIMRGIGGKKTPGRVPKQLHPTAIEREFGTQLAAMIGTAEVRRIFAPLDRELPEILASAARERARVDALREDAGESRRVRELMQPVRDGLRRAVKQDDVEALARKFAARTSTHQRIQLGRQTKSALGVDIMFRDPKLAALTDEFITHNVSLITGIGPQIAQSVESDVLAAVSKGMLHKDLAKKLEARYGFGERRSKLIARDQVGKYYGQVNASRQREIGISHFIWTDSGDDRVRDEHAAVDGQRFSYDEPPDFGNGPALPGEEILCRCTAQPDFSDVFGRI